MALRTDDDQVSTETPGYQPNSYNPRALSADERSQFDEARNYNSDADNNRAAGINDMESTPSGSWKNNVTSQSGVNDKNYTGKGVNRALGAAGPMGKVAAGLNKMRGRGGLIGIISGLLLLAMVVFGLVSFSPVTYFMKNLMENNDSSSVAMERRFMKAFMKTNSADDPTCKSRKINCWSGRISNSALAKLERKGVRACFDGNCNTANTKRTGMPDKNPTHYRFDVDGDVRIVPVSQLGDFYRDSANRKYSAKVFGRFGAYNMMVQAWAGKQITNKLNKAWGLKLDGGSADGKNKKHATKQAMLKAAYTRMEAKIPTVERLRHSLVDIRSKVRAHLNKAKIGGVSYLSAYGGCMLPKIPLYIAGGVAAIQLAQITNMLMNDIYSPGTKIPVSGLDESLEVTPEDYEIANTLLTEPAPRPSDGAMTAAVDSKYLMYAAGLDSARPPIHETFTPGYAALMLPAVTLSARALKFSKPTCDVITHQNTMYAAMAADGAITALASATIIGGIAKVAASWVVSQMVTFLLGSAAQAGSQAAIGYLADNDTIAQAKGEARGDVLGIAAVAFGASGGMANGLPTLKENQVADYQAVRQTSLAFRGELEAASLSPFDISSRHTFLGSIMHSFHTMMLTSPGNSYASKLVAMLPNPLRLISSPLHANSIYPDDYCSYGKHFAMLSQYGTDSPISQAASEAPTRNMAGLPCVGLLPEQAAMSSEQALQLMIDEGWVNPDVDVPAGASLDELISAGVINRNNPLADYIENCTSPATGDYLFTSDSCTVDRVAGDSMSDGGQCVDVEDDEGNTIEVCPDDDVGVDGIDNELATLAITPFLIDYQIIQSINGEAGLDE